MTFQLANAVFKVTLNPEKGTFSIATEDQNLPNIQNAHLMLDYKLRGIGYVHPLKGWVLAEPQPKKSAWPEQGDIEVLTFDVPADQNEVACRVQFGILQEYPLVVWKVYVTNQGKKPIEMQAIGLLELNPELGGKVVWTEDRPQKDLGFFSNGWQSWSPSQWYAAD
ncbi:hypothetical protein EG832_12050, partial [bacterium]|nr:hypothetical protein [bacterium]